MPSKRYVLEGIIASSTNRLYHPGRYGGIYKDKKVVTWTEQVVTLIKKAWGDREAFKVGEELSLFVVFGFKTIKKPKKRDLDNCFKPFIDCLKKAGCMVDDDQIVEIYSKKKTREATNYILFGLDNTKDTPTFAPEIKSTTDEITDLTVSPPVTKTIFQFKPPPSTPTEQCADSFAPAATKSFPLETPTANSVKQKFWFGPSAADNASSTQSFQKKKTPRKMVKTKVGKRLKSAAKA
jgi:Holliday junction resolvase RusA-like endonuclease